MGKHPNPKPQTTRIQDPTKLLVGEGKRGKQRSQDPQMGTSLARCERRRSREPPLPPWLEPLDPLAVATPPYLLGGGSYPPATCVVFLGGGVWLRPSLVFSF